jgi:hypothetical protein
MSRADEITRLLALQPRPIDRMPDASRLAVHPHAVVPAQTERCRGGTDNSCESCATVFGPFDLRLETMETFSSRNCKDGSMPKILVPEGHLENE